MRRFLYSGLVGLAFGVSACVAVPSDAPAASSQTYRQLQLFGDVFERVRAEYVEEVTDEELIEAAISGMLTSLDPHSGYLPPKNYRDMQVQTRGEFGGLGIEVTMENGLVKVVAPIDDTPAAKAGMQPGDLITHIDDEPVLGLTLAEAVERMRGPVNTDISITVRREGTEEPLDITLRRAIVKIQSVRARPEEDVGYVRITAFNEQTETTLAEAVGDLRSQIGEGMRGLVLDLRNNPGGLLDQAVAVADAFLDGGEIVSTRGRRNDSIQRFNARQGDLAEGLPMVVLINNGSASASEIVAGALQDHRRALVMGTPSFGKGSVQTVIPLPGHGAMRLTTALYYTPSGRSIQAQGIEPDIEVQQARLEVVEAGAVRRESDLRNRLPNGSSREEPAPPAEGAVDEEGAVEEPDGDAVGTEQPTVPGDAAAEQADYQLERALDLLRGLALFAERVQ
jgi:carboxyl-terminal processing protease